MPTIPGPRSRRLSEELRRYESPNVTFVSEEMPIFWEEGEGVIVTDVDGNKYIDMTSGFGTLSVGHSNPRVAEAISNQARKLLQGLGDVHPPRPKVELLKALASIAPEGIEKFILSSTGSEAVESALKTAAIYTGKPGVIAFYGSYHGLGYGALEVTSREDFRKPFLMQLGRFAKHVPYPYCYRCPLKLEKETCDMNCLDLLNDAISFPGSGIHEIGAVIVEPIQGRGGIVVPPDGWFRRLKEICSDHGVLLISDEIFTGFGRTGSWFASEIPPDIICMGKGMGGGFPISACGARSEVMDAWGESKGEAIHTSTFLGNPMGCAAAIAVIEEIREKDLIRNAENMGHYFIERLREIAGRKGNKVGEIRGKGLMIGIEIVDKGREPNQELARRISVEMLRNGIIILIGGTYGNVLEFIPPLIVERPHIDRVCEVLDSIFTNVSQL